MGNAVAELRSDPSSSSPFSPYSIPDDIEKILNNKFLFLQHTQNIEFPTAAQPYAVGITAGSCSLSCAVINTAFAIRIPKYQWFEDQNDIIKLWHIEEKQPEKLEQEAFLAIASKFSKIKDVQSIYVQKYKDEVQIQVLLSIAQDDPDLMYELIDIEYDILTTYPDIFFDFFYPPVGISDKIDFIHPEAQCIYER